MRALITGATGFLGAALATRLLDEDHTCRLLGRRADAVQHLVAVGAEFMQLDLRDPVPVADACKGIDIVFHCGALAAPWGRRQDFYDINVGGTDAIVAGCKKYEVQRLVHVSSPSILFNGEDQFDLVEDSPLPHTFISHYAWSKSIAEQRVRQAMSFVDTVIIRPDAIFGPGDRILLPRIVAAAKKRRLPQIGNGLNVVDITYIDNVVHALVLASSVPQPRTRCYTITNDEHVQVWAVIRSLLKQLGIAAPSGACPLFMALAAAYLSESASRVTGREPPMTRYGVLVLARSRTYCIDAAKRELGYRPLVSVDEGLRRTVAAIQARHGA